MSSSITPADAPNICQLFTMFLEYKGGTYLSQISSRSLDSALTSWPSKLNEQDLNIWQLTRDDVVALAKSDRVEVNGLRSVFCVTHTSQDNELMLLHVVGTRD